MTILLGIILTIAVFTCIVFIHEMGHFLTARMTGMKVDEFGIGIPPKAMTITKDRSGTEYTLNWLPIGGFVRIQGEDPASPEAKKKDSFSAKKWWARALVLVAGVTMNFLLAFVIFFFFLISGASPIGPNFITEKDYGSHFLPSLEQGIRVGYITHSGIVLSPLTGSIAQISGIRKGEKVEKIGGATLLTIEDFRHALSAQRPVTLTLSLSGVIRDVTVTPKDGKIGTYIDYDTLGVNNDYHPSYTVLDASIMAFRETWALSRLTLDVLMSTLRKLISPATPTERHEATQMLSGPIGIGSTFTQVVDLGLTAKILFSIIALLSINLGVLNLLPFPALDGGRLFSTSVMAIVGLFTKKNDLLIRIERYFHSFGMVVLLLLSLIVAGMDVWKLF